MIILTSTRITGNRIALKSIKTDLDTNFGFQTNAVTRMAGFQHVFIQVIKL